MTTPVKPFLEKQGNVLCEDGSKGCPRLCGIPTDLAPALDPHSSPLSRQSTVICVYQNWSSGIEIVSGPAVLASQLKQSVFKGGPASCAHAMLCSDGL